MSDYALGSTITLPFSSTYLNAATSLVGATVAVFAGSSSTPITAGVTLTTDVGGVTGINVLTIVATSGNGFAAGEIYYARYTAGTLGGQAIGPRVIEWFSLEREAAFGRLGAPAGASLAADVAAVKTDSAAVKVKTDFLPSATAGAAGGVFIAGSNAATTATTLTVTGAFSINGTGAVAQTGDSFARIGATGSGLTSLAPAATALSSGVWTAPPTGFLAATFPGTVASTTNITAATGIVLSGVTDANITKVNGYTVNGAGTSSSPWGP